jgi:hypothetical protein
VNQLGNADGEHSRKPKIENDAFESLFKQRYGSPIIEIVAVLHHDLASAGLCRFSEPEAKKLRYETTDSFICM